MHVTTHIDAHITTHIDAHITVHGTRIYYPLLIKMSTVHVAVDYRERDLIECLATRGTDVVNRGLDAGDVMLYTVDTDGTEHICLLIERKKTPDLTASIKDGRWREQKTRLMECSVPSMLLVEGPLEGQVLPRKTLVSAITNTITRDALHVVRTYSIDETCDYIRHFMENVAHPPLIKSTMRTPRSKRARESHPLNVFIRQLMCIPGVSETVARGIAAKHASLTILQEALRSDPVCLGTVRISASRRVGRGISAHVRRAVL